MKFYSDLYVVGKAIRQTIDGKIYWYIYTNEDGLIDWVEPNFNFRKSGQSGRIYILDPKSGIVSWDTFN